MRAIHKFYILDHTHPLTGSVPKLVCDAPSLGAAVDMERMLYAKMSPGQVACVDDPEYTLASVQLVSDIYPLGQVPAGEDDCLGIDFSEVQVIRMVDGNLCWIDRYGDPSVVPTVDE